MKIILKNMQKVEHAVELSGPAETVSALCQKAESVFGVDHGAVTLVHLGTVLGDQAKTLSEAGIADGALVIVVLKKGKVNQSHPTPNPSSAPVQIVAAPQTPAASSSDQVSPKMQSMINLSVMHGNDVRAVDVDSDETIENVKAVLEVEYNIPLSKQILVFEGKIMNNGSRLCDLNVRNNDMILLELHRPAPQPQASRPASATSNAAQRGPINLGMLGSLFNPLQRYMKEAEELLQLATVDPFLRRRIAENNAPLAAALESNSVQNVAKELADIHRQRAENEAKKQAAIIRLNSNPLDVEAQREIEEAIRLENINSNLEQAMEYNPESFGRVVMLYVDCEVNSKPLKAFVDSGAQSTIMSLACAERLGLMRLVDKRYAGIAKGVGTSKIVGRVHAVDMKMGSNFFPISITVLENNDMEFLFGLDNLRRHQCILDFKDNVLRIGSDAVPFLGEGDIPLHLRQAEAGDDDMDTDTGAPAKQGEDSGGAAASSTASAAATTTPPAAGVAAEFPGAAIDALTGMGFTREQALMALRSANGSAELAASLLFGGD